MVWALALVFVFGTALTAVPGMAASPQPGVAELTRQLQNLRARYQPGDAAALTAMIRMAATREQRLAQLIGDRPDLVLRLRLAAGQRATFPAEVQAYLEEDFDDEGALEVIHEDGPGDGRYEYFLRAGHRLSLHFAKDPPRLLTDDRVRVSGLRVRQAVALSSGQTQVSLVAAAAASTLSVQPTAVILVRFQDNATQNWLTTVQAQDVVFGTGASVSNFFYELSYQRAALSGDVFGIYTIPLNTPATDAACDPSAIATAAQTAAAAHGAILANYTRFVFSFPGNACAWAGRATVGGNPAMAWINGAFTTPIVGHEMGHNYGLWHSHAWDCGTQIIGTGCTKIEYGDTLDTMGATTPAKHFNAVQKERIGWLNSGSAPPITTVQSSGVYSIDPYESVGTNPKALKVRTPSGDWYYVEYRQALGVDAGTVSGNTNVKNGVVIHWWSQQNPDGIYLLDMTPSTSSWTDPALDLNDTFSDPVGISITPVWVNSTAGVNVTVSGGGSTCTRADPTVQVSPPEQQSPPSGTLSYTVSVTNNDSGCAAASFTLAAAAASGWSVSFDTGTLSIGAGATLSATMQVQSSASAPTGSYTVTATATNASASTYTGSAAVLYDVVLESGPTWSDNFDRPDSVSLGNGWVQVTGTLTIQSDEVRSGAARAPDVALAPGSLGTTQTLSVNFASSGNSNGPRFGLIVRYQDPQNYYACYRQTGGTSRLRIVKVVNGVETVLKWVSVKNPVKNAVFTLGCQAQSATISLSLGGVAQVSVADSSFASGSAGLLMGYAAHSGSGVSHRADNFSMTVQ